MKIASTSPSVQTACTTTSRAGDYVLVNGVKAGTVWRPCSTVWRKPSTAMNNLKWTIPFNCPSPKSIMRLREPNLHQSSAIVGSRDVDENTRAEIQALFNRTFCLPENMDQLRLELEDFHL